MMPLPQLIAELMLGIGVALFGANFLVAIRAHLSGSKPARIQRVLHSRPAVSHPGNESPERRRCSLAGGDALRQFPKLLGRRRTARRSTTINFAVSPRSSSLSA